MLKNLKYLIFFTTFFFLKACSNKVEIYKQSFYSKDFQYSFDMSIIQGNFVLCSNLFEQKANIEYQANFMCSVSGKKAIFVRKEFFSTCYLFKPVSSVYYCG